MSETNNGPSNPGQGDSGKHHGVPGTGQAGSFSVSGMYREWFPDYATTRSRRGRARADGPNPCSADPARDETARRRLPQRVANIIQGTRCSTTRTVTPASATRPAAGAEGPADRPAGQSATSHRRRAAAPRHRGAPVGSRRGGLQPHTTGGKASHDGRNKEPPFRR